MKTTRKLTAWLLTLALALTLAPPLGGSARAAWSGEGDGTSENPYKIGTAEQLKAFRDIVNGENGETKNTGACAVLTADIDLNNEAWMSIGSSIASAYTGTFDGKGYTISRLNVSIITSGLVHAGLFGYVGAYSQPGTVRNVHVSGSVSAESTTTGAYVGGVVGLNYKGTVSNCTYTGAVSATGKSSNGVYAGGVVGENCGKVDGCLHVGGDVSATSDSTLAYAGGIAGVSSFGSVQHSAHTGGTVTATVTEGNNNAYAGGVMGRQFNSATTEYCFSTGGAVTASSSSGTAAAGGVTGENYYSTLTDCYYDYEKANGLTAVGGAADTETVKGLKTEQFADPANFPGWDFDTVWYMGADGPELWAIITRVSTWDELNAALKAGGSIVLDADVTAGGGDTVLTVPSGKTVTLDLNGKTIDRNITFDGASSACRAICVNGTLTLNDSSGNNSGTITGGNCSGATYNGGGVYVNGSGARFTMNGGTISGNKAFCGGGVSVDNSGTFTMNGGVITGNTADFSGGGVRFAYSTFTMTSGSITGNTAGGTRWNDSGGGVYAAGTFKLSGNPTISGNTLLDGTTARNVYLNTGTVITVAGALTNTTPIGVSTYTAPTAGSPVTFTSGLSGNGALAKFASDNGAYTLALNGTEAALYLSPKVTFDGNGSTGGTMAAQTIPYSTATVLSANAFSRDGYTFAGWNTAADGTGDPYAAGASVTLTSDLTLYAQWTENPTPPAPPAPAPSVPSYYPDPTPPTHPPSVADAQNGTVTVSPKNPQAGDKVTITVTPDTGYQVESVTVTDAFGKNVTVKDNGDGTYAFTQPSGKVTIKVTFAPISAPTLTTAELLTRFSDLQPGAWYLEPVRYMVERGIMSGTDKGFEPNAATTQGMMEQILYNLDGNALVAPAEGEAWWTAADSWAAKSGVTTGVAAHDPSANATREQDVVMMYNYARSKGYDTGVRADLSRFSDADGVSDWAREAMAWAVAVGIINGTVDQDGNIILDAQGTATRAQVAAIVQRFCENVVK